MQKYIALFAALASSVAGHGYISSPTPRPVGSEYEAVCGSTIYNNQASDKAGPVQLLLQSEDTIVDVDKCNLMLCKGYQFADNTDIQTFSLGQTIPVEVTIVAPHTGYANVSIVDASTNTVIGDALATWDVYASTSTGIAANNTNFDITIPTDLEGCTTKGECLIQWFWYAPPSVDQTYESCIDFVIGDGSSDTSASASAGTASATSAASSAASSAVVTTSAISTSAATTSAVETTAAATSTASSAATSSAVETSATSAVETAASSTAVVEATSAASSAATSSTKSFSMVTSVATSSAAATSATGAATTVDATSTLETSVMATTFVTQTVGGSATSTASTTSATSSAETMNECLDKVNVCIANAQSKTGGAVDFSSCDDQRTACYSLRRL